MCDEAELTTIHMGHKLPPPRFERAWNTEMDKIKSTGREHETLS